MNARVWHTEFVSSGRCQIEYRILRNHPDLPWMVFFHGFGQQTRAFEPVFEVVKGHFNLLSIHNFYHGNSTLAEDYPLKKNEWKEILLLLLKKEAIENMHITAFSMGAKFALTTLELLPVRILSLQLLAPDGFVMNPWYRFATQTTGGRSLLRFSIRFMPFFRRLVWILSKSRILKPALGRFAEHQLATKEQRQLVENVWINFRRIWPDWKLIPEIIQQNSVRVRVILGKYDSIIPTRKFKPLRPEWRELEWIVLDSGHSKLIERYAEMLGQQNP